MNFHYLVQKSSLGALRRSPRKRPSSTREMMEESDKEFETDADTPSSSWTVCSTYHKQFHLFNRLLNYINLSIINR